jgi:hypothetical protein
MNENINISNEEKFLIGLCRLKFTEEQLKKFRDFSSLITDWDLFTGLASSHGVAALVYSNLEKYQLLKDIPGESVSLLRGALMKSVGRNAFHTEAMGEVLRLLNENDIKTVLLKGFALENTVYGNAGLRQMSDVDILIAKEQCIKARNILIRNGYVSLPVKSVFHKLIIASAGKHLPSLIKDGASVEIHHELFGDRKKTLTRMFYESSYEIDIKGEKAFIPRPQIFFIYLVRHLHMHEMNNESQLRLYTDLVIMIERYSNEIINYDLLSHASEAGMCEILAGHLEPLRYFWGIQFPGWVDDFIEKYNPSDSLSRFIFFLKSPKDNPPLGKPGFYRNIIRDIPGFHRKLLYILGDLFPTIAFMKKRYKCTSTWRVLLYYPHRLGKLWWMVRG